LLSLFAKAASQKVLHRRIVGQSRRSMPINYSREISAPVSVLMPVCNEAEVIEEVIEEWVRDVFQYFPEGSEFLIDEAASKDGTREILARLCEKYPFLHVAFHEVKDGFAAATRRLYAAAKCPLVFFTDSDGQYVPEDFWKLAKHIDRYDVVHGAKLGRKDPLPRRLASMMFNKLAGFLFEIHYLDINSAFRLMKHSVIEELLGDLTIMPTLINAEFLLRCELTDYDIRQVHIRHRERLHGRSRGLPLYRFPIDGFKAGVALFELKESYRK
jgi:glycosyltransferase involved in cell wall biosynthesis